MVLDFTLHFRVTFSECTQMFEGSDNTMAPREVDTVALGPNGNLKGGIRCFSLLPGRVLSRQWRDAKVIKIPENAIRRINFIVKKQKSIKVLKFSDSQNRIDQRVSTGVEHDDNVQDDSDSYHRL